MSEVYTKGFAFIFEGETEKQFYFSLLDHLCKKHGATIERIENKDDPDIIYELNFADKKSLIKFVTANSITKIHCFGNWFNYSCYSKHNIDWIVFLCYDTDNYKYDISKFYENEWKELRELLGNAKKVIDIAAAADIEDIMLKDLMSVLKFISAPQQSVTLRGRKGKVRMKNLFRDNNCTYHEGKRARPLIDLLDKQLLIDDGTIPLKEIEENMFK